MEHGWDFILSGYVGLNQMLRVKNLPRAGVTELVLNDDHSALHSGGNAFNVAVCLAKLGKTAMPIFRGGHDFADTGFLQNCRDHGVCLDGMSIVEKAATPLCYLVQDDHKNQLTLFYTGSMDARFAPEDLPDAWFAKSKTAVLLVGARPDNELFLAKVKRHGLPLAFGMRADFDAFPEKLLWQVLCEAKWLFMNKIECKLITEMYGLPAITALFGKGKAAVIVVTLGAEGSRVYEADGTAHFVPPTPERHFVDPTGAGDSYMAGFLYGWSEGKTAVECAEYGSTVASFVVEETGCITCLPNREEMLERNARRITQTREGEEQ